MARIGGSKRCGRATERSSIRSLAQRWPAADWLRNRIATAPFLCARCNLVSLFALRNKQEEAWPAASRSAESFLFESVASVRAGRGKRPESGVEFGLGTPRRLQGPAPG